MHTEKILMKLSIWLFDERDELLNNLLKRGFDSEPAYNGKHVKTEIEYYAGLINTTFHGGKVPQEGYQCICLSVILIDSVFATGKKFDPQVFVEEYKQIVNEKKKVEVRYFFHIKWFSPRQNKSKKMREFLKI